MRYSDEEQRRMDAESGADLDRQAARRAGQPHPLIGAILQAHGAPRPAGKQRYCWNCGEDMGFVENKYWDRRDTCGKVECNRATADAIREERDEAHRDLDERMGW